MFDVWNVYICSMSFQCLLEIIYNFNMRSGTYLQFHFDVRHHAGLHAHSAPGAGCWCNRVRFDRCGGHRWSGGRCHTRSEAGIAMEQLPRMGGSYQRLCLWFLYIHVLCVCVGWINLKKPLNSWRSSQYKEFLIELVESSSRLHICGQMVDPALHRSVKKFWVLQRADIWFCGVPIWWPNLILLMMNICPLFWIRIEFENF